MTPALTTVGCCCSFIIAASLAFIPSAQAAIRAGAAVVDISPTKLPVLVNGGMLSRYVDKIKTPVNARAIVVADEHSQLAIVVVDSCMMGRFLLDEAKALAAQKTGIAADHILISATHAHSAPSCMGALGTPADENYVPLLREKLVEAIALAQSRLEPARLGFGKEDAADFTALRQWIRRPDKLTEDPFGNMSVRANMHAGRVWDDVTGEAGPEDPDLSLLSIQAKDGRPIAVMGNFSMHYFGDKDISADYFGLFAEGLTQRITKGAVDAQHPFVGIMSHGCSGDIYRVDYTVPEKDRPKPTIDEYTNGLLDIAMKAYATIKHKADANIAMAEQRMTLKYRVPDKQRLEWAQRIVTEMGDRAAKTQTEVYAQEQIILHEKQQTEIVVQALRLGDVAIATTPCETYAITGLKIKAASPLIQTMVIELANGGDGYIPPVEQHPFGGYNTWAARSAGLEVMAEAKITQTAIRLLEQVAQQPRRSTELALGSATAATLALKPLAYWRLNEFYGPHAADASGHGHHAVYEAANTFYLEGPRGAEYVGAGLKNRAPHFVGSRLRAQLAGLGDHFTIGCWVWNGMPNEAREVSGWIFSRDHDNTLTSYGDHLGIGGTASAAGKLIFQHGREASGLAVGKTELPRWTWQHVTLVRNGAAVRAYLNGKLELEAKAEAGASSAVEQVFFAGRSDNESNFEGRVDEVVVFDRALSADEVTALATAKPEPRD